MKATQLITLMGICLLGANAASANTNNYCPNTPQSLNNDQLGALIYTAGLIKSCSTYSLNYGQNKPYEEVCVNRLVENVIAGLEDLKQ